MVIKNNFEINYIDKSIIDNEIYTVKIITKQVIVLYHKYLGSNGNKTRPSNTHSKYFFFYLF